MADQAAAGKQLIGGTASRPLADVKAGIKVDVTKLNQVKSAVDGINASLMQTKKLMSDISMASANMQSKLGTALGTRGAGGKGSYLPPGLSTPPGAPTPPKTPSDTKSGGYLSSVGGAFYATQVIGQAIGGGVATIDRRIDSNMAYSLPADRLSVLQQQMTGLSQNQIANQTRKPLTAFRLGGGGINSLLSNQSQYGINAQQQAPGYAALRAVSGYSLSTQDLVGIQNQLTSPQVANRMFNLMGGFNFNGPGGTTKSLFQGIQQLSKTQGLDNPNILRGAFEQGSRTRANLANLGLDATTQTLVLQYAQENQTFKKKGGKGDYDPNKKADQRLMGIDENFATQSEETSRLQTARDENMYRRQADNYADLERSNQQLIKALGSLEDKFSSVIGARASSRTWQRTAGGILKGVGAATALFAPEVGIPAYLLGSAIGDAPVNGDSGSTPSASVGGSSSDVNDSKIMIPTGYGGSKKSISAVKNMPTFSQMKPQIKDRLLRAFREHPSLGIGQGFRSSAEQQALFLQRHHVDPNGNLEWNGKKWSLNPGVAPAATPGHSFHEAGLAADLVGDIGWLQQNASRFGLKTFANVNGEPWHVQPIETPNSFSGGTGSGDNSAVSVGTSIATTATSAPAREGAPGGWGPSSLINFNGSSIQDILNTVLGQRPHGSTTSFSKGSKSAADNASSTTSTSATATGAGGALTMAQVAQLAYDAGFRGEDIARITAIGWRETRLKPNTHVVNAKTKDDSYGLFGINMLPNALGPLMTSLGYTGNDLLNPATAARAAHDIFLKDGWRPWTGYRKGVGWDTVPLADAEKAVSAAGLMDRGDPMPVQSGGGGSGGSRTMHVTSSPSISIPISFNINGAPSSLDVRALANQVRSIITQELEMDGMRVS